MIKFLDAIQRNKEFSESFIIPTEREKQNLKVGNLVQVAIFTKGVENLAYLKTLRELQEIEVCKEIEAERLWFEITHIHPDKTISGILLNQPLCINIEKGSLLNFKNKNIVKINHT